MAMVTARVMIHPAAKREIICAAMGAPMRPPWERM
jgi:hypothetical protein